MLLHKYTSTSTPPPTSITDNFERTEDWIELYNEGNAAVDLKGWFLSDKESNPQKWMIPAGSTTIPAHGFLLIWCSGRDLVFENNLHSNFKLAQSKDNEYISLADANGSVIDIFPLTLLGRYVPSLHPEHSMPLLLNTILTQQHLTWTWLQVFMKASKASVYSTMNPTPYFDTPWMAAIAATTVIKARAFSAFLIGGVGSGNADAADAMHRRF